MGGSNPRVAKEENEDVSQGSALILSNVLECNLFLFFSVSGVGNVLSGD